MPFYPSPANRLILVYTRWHVMGVVEVVVAAGQAVEEGEAEEGVVSSF